MERHTFSALITPDPSARKDLLQRYLDRTRTSGILQSRGRYFPASVSCSVLTPHQGVIHAIVRVHLLPGEEADAPLADGQAFAVWADAIVSDASVRGVDLLGDGVIVGREAASDLDPLQARAHQRPRYQRAIPPPRIGHSAPAMARRS